MSKTASEIQLTTFFLDREEYAVDVMKVREITSMMEVTKAANSPYHVEGVVNLRGNIVPIISLRKRLGLPEIDDMSMSCIAVMDFAGELTGFVVDEISDVIRVRRSEIEQPGTAVSQHWIEGIVHRDDRMIILVDLGTLT